jgi:hypothetical protein
MPQFSGTKLASYIYFTFKFAYLLYYILFYHSLTSSYFPLRATVLVTRLHTNYVIIYLSKNDRSLTLLSLFENI